MCCLRASPITPRGGGHEKQQTKTKNFLARTNYKRASARHAGIRAGIRLAKYTGEIAGMAS
jgi:hypothetical protein